MGGVNIIEDVFSSLLGIYKVKPQKLGRIEFGTITLLFNSWKIVLDKTNEDYAISAIPDFPIFEPLNEKIMERWELISESNGRFSYSGPIFGKQMKKYILEALEKYPTKVAIAREAIKRSLMSPGISELYAFYKFKKTEP